MATRKTKGKEPSAPPSGELPDTFPSRFRTDIPADLLQYRGREPSAPFSRRDADYD